MSLEVAVIGATGHVHYVLEGIRELGDARIAAVAPGGPEEALDRVLSVLEPGPDARVYSRPRDLLDHETPDIVAVAPQFHRHAEIARAVIARGIPLYCEKPLALEMSELTEIKKAWEATRTPVGIMLAFRYSPAFSTARKLVAAGAIGAPCVAAAQKSYKRGTRPEFYKTRAGFGGIIPWVGIHAIDWLRWVGGWEFQAVQAAHVKMFRPDYPEMEDAAACLYEMNNGGSAVMSFDFLRPAGAPSHGDDRLRLAGESGVIEVRGDDWLELIDHRGARRVRPEPPPYGPFADFARSVLDPRHTCRISSEDAFRVTEVALRTREAADSRKRITLEPRSGNP